MSKPILILGALLLASIIIPVAAYNSIVSPSADYMAKYLDTTYRSRLAGTPTHQPMNIMMGNYLGKMSVLHDSMMSSVETVDLAGKLMYYGMPHMAFLETANETYMLMLPHEWLVKTNDTEKVMESWELLPLLGNKDVRVKAVSMHEAMEWFMEEVHGVRYGCESMHEEEQAGGYSNQYMNNMGHMGHTTRSHYGYTGKEAIGYCHESGYEEPYREHHMRHYLVLEITWENGEAKALLRE